MPALAAPRSCSSAGARSPPGLSGCGSFNSVLRDISINWAAPEAITGSWKPRTVWYDPADERPSRETVADLVEVYLERHAYTLRTPKEEERRLRTDVLPAIGHVRLAELNRRQIADLLHRKAEAAKERGGNGTTANRLRGLLQRLLNKGVEWGYLDRNPVDRVRLIKILSFARSHRERTDSALASDR